MWRPALSRGTHRSQGHEQEPKHFFSTFPAPDWMASRKRFCRSFPLPDLAVCSQSQTVERPTPRRAAMVAMENPSAASSCAKGIMSSVSWEGRPAT
jgi:hypothetical protein